MQPHPVQMGGRGLLPATNTCAHGCWSQATSRLTTPMGRLHCERGVALRCDVASPGVSPNMLPSFSPDTSEQSQLAPRASSSRQWSQHNSKSKTFSPPVSQGRARLARTPNRPSSASPYLHFSQFTQVPHAAGFVKKALEYHNGVLLSGEWRYLASFQALRILRCARLMLLQDQGQLPIWQPSLLRRDPAPRQVARHKAMPTDSHTESHAARGHHQHGQHSRPLPSQPHSNHSPTTTSTDHSPAPAQPQGSQQGGSASPITGWQFPTSSSEPFLAPGAQQRQRRRQGKHKQLLWLPDSTADNSMTLTPSQHGSNTSRSTPAGPSAHTPPHTHTSPAATTASPPTRPPSTRSSNPGSTGSISPAEEHQGSQQQPQTGTGGAAAAGEPAPGPQGHAGSISRQAGGGSRLAGRAGRQWGRVRLRAGPVMRSVRRSRVQDVTAGGHRPLVFKVQKLLAGPMQPGVIFPVASTTKPLELGMAVSSWLLGRQQRSRDSGSQPQPSRASSSQPQPSRASSSQPQSSETPGGQLVALDSFGRRAPLVTLQALLAARRRLRDRGSDLAVVLLSVPRRGLDGQSTVLNRFLVFECLPGQPAMVLPRYYPSMGFREG